MIPIQAKSHIFLEFGFCPKLSETIEIKEITLSPIKPLVRLSRISLAAAGFLEVQSEGSLNPFMRC